MIDMRKLSSIYKLGKTTFWHKVLPTVVRMTVGRMETGAPQGNRHGLEPKTDIPCSQAPQVGIS